MKPSSRALAFLTPLLVLASACPRGEPRLLLSDRLVEFHPGLFNYDIDRGATKDRKTFLAFGKTHLRVEPDLEVSPVDEDPSDDPLTGDDDPDDKMRVRLTLSGASTNPNGVLTVLGEQDELVRDSHGVVVKIATKEVSEPISVVTSSTHTTRNYFDRVTAVETDGLGVDATLDVEWWDGHEQEMDVVAPLAGVNENECKEGYTVRFDGQEALPDWDPARHACSASLLVGHRFRDGQILSRVYYRGLYFGIVGEGREEDGFFSFDPELGHVDPPITRESWLTTLPYGGYYFAVDSRTDPRVRPLVVQLVRRADGAVVDAARLLLTNAVDPFGNPSLVSMAPEVENPGALAQLSPRGLDRLGPTHAATLPYPIAPAGTQPRLSRAAIALPPHRSAEAEVNLADLPPEDLAYFTEKNPDPGPEFAGYRAYQAIHLEAVVLHAAAKKALELCKGPPLVVLLCQTAIRAANCVDDAPEVENFRIHLDGLDSYFDRSHPDDALVVGDVDHMDLTFAPGTEIDARFLLEDIQGKLEASLDPSRIRIEWDTPAGDPCVLKPRDRLLSDFLAGTADRDGWLTCKDLHYASPSAVLAQPIPFELVAAGESLLTLFGTRSPLLSLALPDTSPGTGTCAEPWLSALVERELLGWGVDVANALQAELVTSPGEDEALTRLLSPFELGLERVDQPPAGTPPYEVHPLAPYSLSARIGGTTSDVEELHTGRRDGLSVPYLTRSSPTDALTFDRWFCPVAPGQTCRGLLDAHPLAFARGVDAVGAPFDVALRITTAHLNQALWAQANRPDRLGSEAVPARLSIADDAVVNLAGALGFDEVVSALAAAGSAFGVRYHEAAAPFTVVNDGTPQTLLYVIPSVEVELVAIGLDRSEAVVAKFVVDVIDNDLRVNLGTGGSSQLTVAWGDVRVLGITTTFLPECYGTSGGQSCAEQLSTVVGALWWPAVQGTLLDMIAATPAPQRFDAGQESPAPRLLTRARAFVDDHGLALFADLCNPATTTCQ